ncbi:hypothetical protein [Paraglaciecola sp. L1A13]|nr:hypothetical protein [Paraglaciecola sp. L1A13]
MEKCTEQIFIMCSVSKLNGSILIVAEGKGVNRLDSASTDTPPSL